MKGIWSFLLYTILMFCINLWCSTTAISKGNESDQLALIAFKDGITRDPLGALSSWNDSLHYCNWSGVKCSHRHAQRVGGLNLGSHGLVGSLSPYIGNLTFLRKLILSNNSFHGQVPSEIGGLFRLRFLELSNNSFEGTLPINLTNCLDLLYLDFMHNKLTGKIPPELGSLPKLQFLYLFENNFTGSIPVSLGNLSNLIELSLGVNSLEGRIPKELGRITSMEFLQLSYNKLTGTIPSSIYNLSSLSDLEIMSNQLEGNIRPDIGLIFPRLAWLSVANNRFTGPIPVSLSNASNLEHMSFESNNFTGIVPQDLGRLQKLNFVNIAENQLGTTERNDLSFISSLANCTQLQYLLFDSNFLRGSLVSSIANLSTQMIGIELGLNQVDGTIPSGIGNLVNLHFLGMSTNRLRGVIPPEIGKLHKLQWLSLEINELIGSIPSSLSNITMLSSLYLGGNNLTGEIPPNLAASQNLLEVILSDNSLNGTIPKQLMVLSRLLVLLDLGRNALTGLLPFEVGNLINTVRLDVSNNLLSGDLPDSLAKCVVLQDLRLNGNFFRGKIPTALQSLRGLEYLDLSRNNFSGHIPDFLGKVHFLTYLNLSFNEFSGEVPTMGGFGNASIISVQGNYNLCGGIQQLNLPKCPSTPSEKKGKHLAVKVVILLTTATSCLSLLALFVIIRNRRIKSNKNVSSGQLYNSQFRMISYSDLHKATGCFSESNIIGVGSYGSVYKGVFDQDGMVIAVKVLNLHRRGASKSFMSECEALRRIRHRNLVKILSACSSLDFQGNDFKALVFELMPQGSLERWLHPEVEEDAPKILNLLQRLNIAIDVATALEYLHNHCHGIIIHSDLKPSNVLLDDDMTAHVSDFGLAKIISNACSAADTQTNQSSSVAVKGSVGYIAPEYGINGSVSIEGDVYSYGILLLEMFTGRRPIDDMFQDGLTLHDFVNTLLPGRVGEVADPQLLSEINERDQKMEECVVSVLTIGISCSIDSPRDRMEMGDVVNKLHSIKNLFLREENH